MRVLYIRLTVQAALKGLQERKLIWRAARGIYALEEPAIAPLVLGRAQE